MKPIRRVSLSIGAAVPASAKVLVIPAARFKSNAQHAVPLTDAACKILATLPHAGGDFVFSLNGKKPIADNDAAKKKLDRLMTRTLRVLARQRRGDDPMQVKLAGWVNHDLRRVVRSALASMDVPNEIAEACLGHGQKGLARIYNQHRFEPQVRAAMTRWADRLAAIVEPQKPKTTNVIPLRG